MLNIKNWEKLRRHLEAISNKEIDQDTFCEALGKTGGVSKIKDLIDCGTPGCLAWHAVAACAPGDTIIDYGDIPDVARRILGLGEFTRLFRSEALGWPRDLFKLYHNGKGRYRRRAMIALVDRILEKNSELRKQLEAE